MKKILFSVFAILSLSAVMASAQTPDKTKAKPEASVVTISEPKPEPKPEPEPQTEPKAKAKPEPKPKEEPRAKTKGKTKDTTNIQDTVSLQTKYDMQVAQNDILSRRVDSLMSILAERNTQIAKKDSVICYHESRVDFVDTCMLRLCNKWLDVQYNKENVDRSIAYFDRIYSNKLKTDINIVKVLLQDYEKAHNEFLKFLTEAQTDTRRYQITANQIYVDTYTAKLVNLDYYKKHYSNIWNIGFLNRMIDKALEILTNHKDKRADFSVILHEMGGQGAQKNQGSQAVIGARIED